MTFILPPPRAGHSGGTGHGRAGRQRRWRDGSGPAWSPRAGSAVGVPAPARLGPAPPLPMGAQPGHRLPRSGEADMEHGTARGRWRQRLLLAPCLAPALLGAAAPAAYADEAGPTVA